MKYKKFIRLKCNCNKLFIIESEDNFREDYYCPHCGNKVPTNRICDNIMSDKDIVEIVSDYSQIIEAVNNINKQNKNILQ